MAGRQLTTALVAVVLLSIVSIPGEAGAAEPWLDEDFESGAGELSHIGGVAASTDGHQGDGVRVSIPKGNHWGATGHWNTKSEIGSEPEEMWLRYWIKFPTGFRVDSPYRGKLPGFGGLYTYNCLGGRPSTASAPCWSARMAFSPMYTGDGLPSYPFDPDKVTRLSFYAYLLNSQGSGQNGKILNWDPDVSTLQHGRWYCVEGRVKMNDLGQSNGVLEGYVDGQNAYSAGNLTFRRASESQLKVKSVWFDVYYGGDGTSPKDNEIFFDSLAAGPSRIGCNDLPQSSGTFYDDDDSIFENAIEKLAASGITNGCNPPANDRFCPEDSVTRGQMAAFLKRALGDRFIVDLPPPPGSPPDFWGGKSDRNYKDALAVYQDGGAPLETYVVRYSIDATSGDKDWMRSGTTGNPNYWVPIQLGRIWDAGATPYVQVTVDDLRGLVEGRFDQRLDRMLSTFASFVDLGGGRRLIVDILPDSNNRSNPYGDDPSRFKTAFRKIAAEARAEIGEGNVRIAFSAQRAMNSAKYTASSAGPGGFHLFWPGSDNVDLAGVSGYATTSGSNVSFFETALNEMANTTGPGVPLLITLGGAANIPSEASQMEYVEGLAELTESHPQMVGVQWDDRISGSLNLRLSSDTTLQSGFQTASSRARSGGLDWLFSNQAAVWSTARLKAIPFDDSTSSVFANAIRWLAETGITQGCGPRAFCPNDRVTRGQMAAFLSRALKLGAPAQPIEFSDSRGHVFENAISKLAHAGITVGCNPPTNSRFCPDRDVTRGQMAAFMVRAGLAG